MFKPDGKRTIDVLRFPSPVSYSYAYEKQTERLLAIEAGTEPNALFLLEHTPTFTFGRSSHEENLLASQKELVKMGIAIERVDRGGDITYHGPGQLVAYPILNLEYWTKSVQWYLRMLEDVIIDVLARYAIRGERVKGYTGVWVNGAKIAAVGIGIRQWVTYHGVSINLTPNIDHWSLIVPCGIPDKPVACLHQFLESPPSMDELMDVFEETFLHRCAISVPSDPVG